MFNVYALLCKKTNFYFCGLVTRALDMAPEGLAVFNDFITIFIAVIICYLMFVHVTPKVYSVIIYM